MTAASAPVRAVATEAEQLGGWLPRGRLAIGRIVVVRGRTFEIVGFDPVSVRPRRLYLKNPATGSEAVVQLEVPET